MSSVPAPGAAVTLEYAGRRSPARPSITLHNYLRTLAWTLSAVGVCCAGYAIEKYLVIWWLHWLPDNPAYRMFKNPAELPMRLFGLPHFVVGTMFLLSSKRMKGARSWLQLAGLAALGIGICYAFHAAGAHSEPLAVLMFYFYFLIHGFRDEAFFYKSYGEMPRDSAATHERIMAVLQGVMLGLLMSMIVPAYSIYGRQHARYHSEALDMIFPANWPYVLRFLMLLGPMLVVAALALRRIARQFPDGLRGLYAVHRPILLIFAISSGIILLSLVSGPWSFNVVVLMHFVGWYLFGRYQLARFAPAAPPTSPWERIRKTPEGFTAFHIGLAVLFALLIAWSHYSTGKSGIIEFAFGSKSFFYWTIMHVTLSFFPR